MHEQQAERQRKNLIQKTQVFARRADEIVLEEPLSLQAGWYNGLRVDGTDRWFTWTPTFKNLGLCHLLLKPLNTIIY